MNAPMLVWVCWCFLIFDGNLKMIDYVIVAIYLVVTLFIGLYSGRKTKNIKEYAIGKRDFSTLILLSAIFATVVDASDTIGLAGNTFLIGPIFLFSYMGMIVSRFLTAYFIAPNMGQFFGLISSGDILEKLFGIRAKTLMGLSTIIESTLLIGAQVLALSHISQYFFDISTEFAAIIGSFFIVIYSFRGGIKSVTSTDVFQFAILIIAIPIVCGVGIIKIGGYDGLIYTIKTKGLSFSSDTNMSYQAAMFISFSLPCLYPLCLQRMLMAKSPAQIKSAFIANGLLSIPFQLIVGTIGLIALILIPDVRAEHAFPALVDKIVPIGLKGLVIAGLLAVIMSTIDSILNIGAIALTNDLVGSLVKTPLKTKTSLRLVKISSVLIAFGATVIAMRFTSIIDLLFYVLMLGNSVYFPGYFLGILGFHGSKKAFWIGVVLGITTMIVGVFFLDMFILHVMLLAITLNASAHLLERFLKNKWPFFWIPRFINKEAWFSYSRYFFVNHWVKDQDYCSIFAICSIGLSVLPFFGPQNTGVYQNETIFLGINGFTASISLLLLFKEVWNQKLIKYFPLLWALLLVIALPLQSFFMFIRTGFSSMWLIEALVILPLLSVLTSRKGLIYSYSIGLVLACIIAAMFPSNTLADDHMGQWAVLIHMITLAICLALFRQKDVRYCRTITATMIHEANRALSTFENAAVYFESLFPVLISSYQRMVPLNQRAIPIDELNEMLTLPSNLKDLSLRTKDALTNLLDRLKSQSVEDLMEKCVINECIKIVLSNPLLIKHKNLITVSENNTLEVLADCDDIIQVFINLIENALYALKNSHNPKISITIRNYTVIIQDNGEGISEGNLPNIFDEGFSTKPKGGQGLAYCKSVLERHGALISCRSKKDLYTKFYISFPKEAATL